MNILITGANGMLGEKCFQILSDKFSTIATDLGEKCLYSDDAAYTRLDITEEKNVIEFIRDLKPDAVINCAAYTDVDGAEINREIAWNVNVKGIKNLVKAIEPIGSHLVHISTDYVFDGVNGPYSENDPPSPINYYGLTKYEGEKVLQELNIPWTILRTNVLFGNSKYQQASFVSWVIRKVSNREVINVVNDQYGNPTWANALAEVISMILMKGATGIYHYGGKDYVSRFSFALEIVAVFDLDPKFVKPTTTKALNQVAKRPYKGGLAVDKIKKELGVRVYSIKEALEAMKRGQ